MPRYRFKCRNARGKVVSGLIVGETEHHAATQLAERKYEVIKIQEARGLLTAIDYWLAQMRKPSLLELAMTTRQVATMFNSGVTIVRSLQVLNQQPLSARLALVWGDVQLEVTRGASLSRALGRYPDVFDSLYVGMAKAGEASGNLGHNLEYLADHLEKEVLLRGKVTAAMTYPAIIFMACLGMVLLITQHILPQFLNGIFRESSLTLPWITRSLITVTDFFNNPVAMGGIVLGLVLGGWMGKGYLSTPAGRRRWQQTILATPALKHVVGKLLAARFCRLMGTLLYSGIPVIHAMELTNAALGNYVLAEYIERIQGDIREGGRLSEGLRRVPFFPPVMASFAELGENTGNLAPLMTKLGLVYEEELDVALFTFTSLLEPLMVGLMGGMVGYVLLAVFIPLYQLMGQF